MQVQETMLKGIATTTSVLDTLLPRLLELSTRKLPRLPEKLKRKAQHGRKAKTVKYGFVTIEWPIVGPEGLIDLTIHKEARKKKK